MYEVYKEGMFSAAHRLVNYHGKCENLHGHNWKVRVYVAARELDESGMVLDFTILKKYLNEVLDYFDHRVVNELPEFSSNEPSAENIARFVFDRMSAMIDDERVWVSRVMVWESEGSCAIFTPDR